MSLKRCFIAMTLAGFAMTGLSAPVFAESGIVVPRAPVLSSRDPVFLGLLISPGFSKCRQLRSYTDWKCSYGGVPRDIERGIRYGGADADRKPAVRAKSSKTSARR